MSQNWPGFSFERRAAESEDDPAARDSVGGEDDVGRQAPVDLDSGTERGRALGREADATARDGSAEEEVTDDVFLTELVRTLQAAAGLERVRIGEEADQRRKTFTDEIRARQETEAERMRQVAEDDLKGIDAWADGEARRIQMERERRTAKRREDLDKSLSEANAQIERQIQGVEQAITAYKADVDVFFDSLDRETNLVRIARHATRRPVFPDLEAAAAGRTRTLRLAGEETPVGVGVMDSRSSSSSFDESLAARLASSPDLSAAEQEAAEEAGEEGDFQSRIGRALGQTSSTNTILQSVPISRPMGRPDDRSNRAG
ncbi:MAG TPA: hypothetical protein VH723_03225 [Candidatus Limnocylindrales bacterium]|jgi:hypothetical protein